ncbi:flagellar hook assembly protein FlgD [Parendozoicomonas haliclonae]|uniref:Basal-body rod modification protein FlgD n=1 Tax=Parendozoicomonas haliclonae TaxID=1960125 RepID=A0A1X7AGD0_9GAMM|nr:flagellar hook capping FlgD N-terminal domain-containing protein [Parendozoicomonas haliclonae]SMA39788.1 Basal-body rod modification protein FlgD [Parendozoicomonas haliclonae]
MDINGLSQKTVTNTGGVQLGESAGLQQKDFMQMLLAEVNNQDPLQPKSSTDFVAQLAQITSVENLENLNQTLSGMVSSMQYSQAMQATDLVGRTVTVPTSVVEINDGDSIRGEVSLPTIADSLRVLVSDASGQIVGELDLGQSSAGRQAFDISELDLDAGVYSLSAIATSGGEQLKVPVSLTSSVESVVIPNGGTEVELNIAGIGAMPLSQIARVGE